MHILLYKNSFSYYLLWISKNKKKKKKIKVYNLCFVWILRELCNSSDILANIYTPIHTHTHLYILCDIPVLLNMHIKMLGELVLRRSNCSDTLERQSQNIQGDFVTVTYIVFVFLKFLKAIAMVFLHWLKCITLRPVNENRTN